MADTRLPRLNAGWLASVPTAALRSSGRLRARQGIDVCQPAGEIVWLRGPRLDESLDQELRSLLGCQIFRPLDDGQLLPLGATVPQGFAPTEQWLPLQAFLTLSLPPKRFAAELPSRANISLVRSSQPAEPNLLRVSMQDWAHYVCQAPQIRLANLQFAACRHQAVVVGEPLPPIRGDYFYQQQAVAAPVGYRWQPEVDAAVLRKMLQLEEGDIALLLPEGGLSLIKSNQFVGVTRSAVRLTRGGIDAES